MLESIALRKLEMFCFFSPYKFTYKVVFKANKKYVFSNSIQCFQRSCSSQLRLLFLNFYTNARASHFAMFLYLGNDSCCRIIYQ